MLVRTLVLSYLSPAEGVPYSRSAMSEILGASTSQSCSTSTTEFLATEAFRNCASLLLQETLHFGSLTNSNVFGIACSAALVSSSPKKGSHRCYVSSVTPSAISTWCLEMSKGSRTREEEDFVCSRLILDAILSTSYLPPLPVDYLIQSDQAGTETITSQKTDRVEKVLDQLLRSEVGMILFVKKEPEHENSSTFDSFTDEFEVFDEISIPASSLVYPGSFNPFHEGHARLTKAALAELSSKDGRSLESLSDLPVVFEIAVVNADKPPLSRDQILSRVKEFSPSGQATKLLSELGISNFAVCVTSRPLFSTKVDLFPGCRFLLGTDTLLRLFDAKYYEHSREKMLITTGKLVERCQLIVGGRVTAAGEFLQTDAVLAPLGLPDVLTKNILSIPESAFRCDISSTEIRARLQRQGPGGGEGDRVH
jgi:nicotinic acid mononucleotide adenylyltransferase